MSSPRLTNDLKARIRKNLLEQRFSSLEEKMATRWIDFADKVYLSAYGGSERVRLDTAPEGWFPTRSQKRMVFGGTQDDLEFSGSRRFAYEDYSDYSRAERFHFPADHPLTVEYEALARAHAQLNDTKENAEGKIRNVLAQATTVKRLLEIWPEVLPFIPDVLQPVANLPAVPVQEVNCLLGLVSEGCEEAA